MLLGKANLEANLRELWGFYQKPTDMGKAFVVDELIFTVGCLNQA